MMKGYTQYSLWKTCVIALMIPPVFFGTMLYGQCDQGPDPATTCHEAQLLCLEGLCFTLPEEGGGDTHPGWCGSNTAIHNPQYFRIIAVLDSIAVHISAHECFGGGCGIQAAILDACDWTNDNVVTCNPGVPAGGSIILQYGSAVPGQEYWLVIDGCASQVCTYEFVETYGIAGNVVTEIHAVVCDTPFVFDGIPYTAGTHFIVYEDETGESCDTIVVLHIEDQLVVSLDAVSLCAPHDDTLTISPDITGGVGELTFLWHDGNTDSVRQFTGLMHGEVLSVTVTDSEGCSVVASSTVEVLESPVADFTFNVIYLEVSFLNFSLQATSYLWDFGDGAASTLAHPEHVFDSIGAYQVLLIATNMCGSDSILMVVMTTGCEDPEMVFDAHGDICTWEEFSWLLDYPGVEYWEWIATMPPFMMGITEGMAANGHEHKDTLINMSNVPMTVTYTFTGFDFADCAIVEWQVTVMVYPGFGVELPALSVCTPVDTVEIFAMVTGGVTDLTFLWHDGSMDTSVILVNPVAGDTFSVTVTDVTTGCAVAASHVIDMSGPDVVVVPVTLVRCPGDTASLAVVVDIIAGVPPFSLSWTTPSDPVPQPEMPFINDPGTYSVIVTGGDGCATEVEFEVVDGAFPEAAFDVMVDLQEVQFINMSQNADQFFWDFGDGQSSEDIHPVHVFDAVTTYTVTLVAINICGSDTIGMDVATTDIPIPENNTCAQAEDLGILNTQDRECPLDTVPLFLCVEGTNLQASPISGSMNENCPVTGEPVVWYTFTTGNRAHTVNISVKSTEIVMPVIRLYTGSCDSLDGHGLTPALHGCMTGSGGKVMANATPVEPSTTYYLAIGAALGTGGAFTLCINALSEGTPCVSKSRIEIIARSNGGPLTGPLFPEETVRVCMIVEAFDMGFSCQWFQGLVPVFGNGWDPASFDAMGQPRNATLNGNPFPAAGLYNFSEWNWWTDVLYHHPHCMLNVGDFDGNGSLDICHALYDPECTGPGLTWQCTAPFCGPCWGGLPPEHGSVLPPGWFASGVSGACMIWTGHPGVDWGDGNSCTGEVGPWEFCFELTVVDYAACTDSEAVDLSLGFVTFSDGETGSWTGGPSICGYDPVQSIRLPLCCITPEVSVYDHPPICSRSEFSWVLDHPGVEFWSWHAEAPQGFSGITEGTVANGGVATNTIVNHNSTARGVTYFFNGFAGGSCAGIQWQVNVLVFPDILVTLPQLSLCFNIDSLIVEPTISGGGPGYTFLWGDGSTGTTLVMMHPVAGDQITVTVTDIVTGCMGEGMTVIGMTGPAIEVSPLTALYCPGQPGPEITIDILSGTPPFSYFWTSPSNPEPVIEMPDFTEAGTYSVIVSDVSGCTSQQAFEIIEGLPVTAAFDVETEDLVALFTNQSVNALSVYWDFGDGNFTDEENPVYEYASGGTYQVVLIAFGQCDVDTILQNITLSGTATDNPAVRTVRVSVVPNPNDGTFAIVLYGMNFDDPALRQIEIIDILGRQVPWIMLKGGGVRMETPLSGLYTLVLHAGETIYVQKFIVNYGHR